MLTLAAMTWAAYMFSRSELHMLHSVPPPVIIEVGEKYDYKPLEAAIYVPAGWKDSCEEQQLVVMYMLYHFNNFRNRNAKFNDQMIDSFASEWKCIE